MAVAPPLVVDGPQIQAQPYGLFSVVLQPTPDAAGRWRNGVTWESAAPCEAADPITGEICESPGVVDSPGTLASGPTVDLVTALPFPVRGIYRCKSLSHDSLEARTLALNALQAWEERMVERALMAGQSTPSFRGAEALTSEPVSLCEGINLLSGYLATSHHSLGVIHAPRSLDGTLSRQGLLERRGQHLETAAGTLVVLGGGYDLVNTSPSGTPSAEGTAWLYATGRPIMYRGEPFFMPGESNEINTVNNDRTVVALRNYVIGWDCGTAAVQVDATCG